MTQGGSSAPSTNAPRSGAGPDEVWSVKRVLAWAADDLRRRGNESARLDVELLLGKVLGLDRIGLILHAERPLSADELGRFRELFKRRRACEPVAYLLGEREFFGINLKVDARVLVPRPDTERLVEVALERTRARSMLGRALDLCTGSGCVAIAFAKSRPTWLVTASDISPDALAVATENAHRTGAIRNLRLLELVIPVTRTICPLCGRQYTGETRFCGDCGAAVVPVN